jgi:N-acylneuraminate cytidylyltransferase
MKQTVVAITPARGGSQGVPRKNIKLLNGKPLIQHTIEAALSCALIDHYFVNSEDEEIRLVAENLSVNTQNRPEEFWNDNTFQEVDRMLVWCVQDLESKGYHIDVVVLLYPTSPLRSSSHISQCIDLVLNQGYDSALTLKEDRSYIWEKVQSDGSVQPVNYDPKKRGPNQLEGWNQWVENKAVYVVKKSLLMSTGCRIAGRVGGVEMSKLDSIDIDTPDDFLIAEQVSKMKSNLKAQ